jgi:hypothetical protein
LSCVAGDRVSHLTHQGLNALFVNIYRHYVVAKLVQRSSDVTAESAQSNYHNLLLSFHTVPRIGFSPFQFKYT